MCHIPESGALRNLKLRAIFKKNEGASEKRGGAWSLKFLHKPATMPKTYEDPNVQYCSALSTPREFFTLLFDNREVAT